jgi:hypothetical protein
VLQLTVDRFDGEHAEAVERPAAERAQSPGHPLSAGQALRRAASGGRWALHRMPRASGCHVPSHSPSLQIGQVLLRTVPGIRQEVAGPPLRPPPPPCRPMGKVRGIA